MCAVEVSRTGRASVSKVGRVPQITRRIRGCAANAWTGAIAALKKVGVPVEMHLYSHGGHGFGLRRTKSPITEWPQLVERWLETIGITSE